MKKSVIIAFEGIDGSGKTVQLRRLEKHLADSGKTVLVRDYPVYDSYFGKRIGEYLSNANGVSANDVDPQSMALWYAMDRLMDMKNNPDNGEYDYVLMNRYVLSNAVYQSIRANDPAFAEWVFELEHEVLSLPKPDCYIFFDVDYGYATQNVEKKAQRCYTEAKKDVYEGSEFIQVSARGMYLECARRFDSIIVIACVENGVFSDEESISKRVIDALTEKGII